MVGNAWQRFAAVTACASILALGACGRNDANTGDTSAATAGGDVARADSAASATAPGAATAGSTATPGSAGSAMAITGGDPEIVQVLAVVDQGEIQDGQLAQRQARNAKVKAFARELVQDHQKSLAQTRQIAKAVNTTLPSMSSSKAGSTSTRGTTDTSSAAGTASGVAGQLMAMHTQMMDQVRQAQGAAFDTAFVNAQVMGHQEVLDLLQRAQGQAQNSEVQQHLTAAMKSVQEHLDHGRELQQSLTNAGMGSDSASKSGSDTTSKTRPDTSRRG